MGENNYLCHSHIVGIRTGWQCSGQRLSCSYAVLNVSFQHWAGSAGYLQHICIHRGKSEGLILQQTLMRWATRLCGATFQKKDGVLWNSAAHYPARSHFHHPLLSPPPDHFQKMKQKQKLRSRYLHFNQETQSFANLNEKQSLGSRVPKLQSHFIKELTWSMAVWKINYPRTPTLTTEPWSGDKISFLKMKNYF